MIKKFNDIQLNISLYHFNTLIDSILIFITNGLFNIKIP